MLWSVVNISRMSRWASDFGATYIPDGDHLNKAPSKSRGFFTPASPSDVFILQVLARHWNLLSDLRHSVLPPREEVTRPLLAVQEKRLSHSWLRRKMTQAGVPVSRIPLHTNEQVEIGI